MTDGTLVGTLADLAHRGFTEAFAVAGDGLRAAGTVRTFRAEDLTIREFHRFEGVSDPDDMSIVYAIETRDGTRGTLVTIPAGTPHHVRSTGAVPLFFLTVYAPPEY